MREQPDDNEMIRKVDALPGPTAADAGADETGEASFPASDPPASWTWDVAGHPPGA